MLADLLQDAVMIDESPTVPAVDSGIKPSLNVERFNPESDPFAQKFNEVIESLAEDYQEGTRDYIRENHPALLDELRATDNRMIAAWRSLDFPSFKENLTRWEEIQREMIQKFHEAAADGH